MCVGNATTWFWGPVKGVNYFTYILIPDLLGWSPKATFDIWKDLKLCNSKKNQKTIILNPVVHKALDYIERAFRGIFNI